MEVFDCDKERIKAAVMKEAKNFCDMIDCAEEPPALDYMVEQYGVRLRIEAECI